MVMNESHFTKTQIFHSVFMDVSIKMISEICTNSYAMNYKLVVIIDSPKISNVIDFDYE